jgi:hypothetical protein
MKLVGCTLEIRTVVGIDGPWFSSARYEASQGSKECFSSEACDNLNMNCPCSKTDKNSNITLCYNFAAWSSQF